jgi:hypothetical protein
VDRGEPVGVSRTLARAGRCHDREICVTERRRPAARQAGLPLSPESERKLGRGQVGTPSGEPHVARWVHAVEGATYRGAGEGRHRCGPDGPTSGEMEKSRQRGWRHIEPFMPSLLTWAWPLRARVRWKRLIERRPAGRRTKHGPTDRAVERTPAADSLAVTFRSDKGPGAGWDARTVNPV